MSIIEKGAKLRFADDPYEFTILGVSEKFVIMMRPPQPHECEPDPGWDEDDPMYFHWVDSLPTKDDYLYTIWNRETMMRGPHNLICSGWDYRRDADVEDCLRQLDAGEIWLSQRTNRCVPVVLAEDGDVQS